MLATSNPQVSVMATDGALSAPTLKAWGVTRSFGSGETKSYALRNVSLELYPGQITLLMGPSGSGKSTLLAVLSGLLHPDTGTVLVLEKDLWGMTERSANRFAWSIQASSFRAITCSPR